MKRALCVILMVSMLLSMLTGCSDDDSPTHDETIVVDGLTIDTITPDRTGLYDLYWIPLPTGTPYLANNEIEYNSDVVSNVRKTLNDACISYAGELIVPVYHWTKESKFIRKDPATGNDVYESIPPGIMTISLDDFSYEITALEWLDGEFIMHRSKESSKYSEPHCNLLKLRSTYDGGYFGLLQKSGEYFFLRWDHTGKRISTVDVLAAVEAAGEKQILPGWYSSERYAENKATKIRFYDYLLDAGGNLYITGNSDSGGPNDVCAWSAEGEFLYSFQMPGSISPAAMTRLFTVDSAGQAGIICQNRDGGNLGYEFYVFDDELKNLGEPVQLAESDLISAPQLAPGFDAYQIIAMGIQAYLKGTDPIMLMNWVDYDIRYSNVKWVKVISANRICFAMEDPESKQLKLGLFTADNIEGQVAEQLAASKTELTLAYIAGNKKNSVKTIETYVTEFNMKNPDYRVKMLAYTELGNQSAEERLIGDMLAGKVPDMILFDSDMNYRRFDNLNLFVDLYPFMDKDKTYTRDAFFDCVKTPFENADGELPYLTIQYGISTLVLPKSIAGKMESWNMTQMAAFAGELSDEQYFTDIQGLGTSDAPMVTLRAYLQNIIGQYVDYENAVFSMGDDLAKLLEFCQNANVKLSNNGSAPPQYRDGTVSVRSVGNARTVQDFLVSRYVCFSGDEVTYIGYPTDGGSGTAIVPMTSLAITKQCKTPDGAWEFITASLDLQREEFVYKITPEQLADGRSPMFNPTEGFSGVIDTVRLMCETLKHYYFIYGLKQSPTNPDSLSVSRSIGGTHFAADGGCSDDTFTKQQLADVTNKFYTITDEDAADLLELLHGITMVRSFDTDLLDIIYEDASYYLSGTKSLDETVRIIENRVKIKLSE